MSASAITKVAKVSEVRDLVVYSPEEAERVAQDLETELAQAQSRGVRSHITELLQERLTLLRNMLQPALHA